MKFKAFKLNFVHYSLIISVILLCISCSKNKKKSDINNEKVEIGRNANDIIPFFKHWNLILGDGSNVGQATNYENKNFFYTAKEDKEDWVVFKTPNAGNTHGTSNNTRTELAQLKKWSPMTEAKMNATLKVMNVQPQEMLVLQQHFLLLVGQIHSADGHENEPLKIFYKKFPGHTKGSVFWNYEINTAGDDNSGRWDYSLLLFGVMIFLLLEQMKTSIQQNQKMGLN